MELTLNWEYGKRASMWRAASMRLATSDQSLVETLRQVSAKRGEASGPRPSSPLSSKCRSSISSSLRAHRLPQLQQPEDFTYVRYLRLAVSGYEMQNLKGKPETG